MVDGVISLMHRKRFLLILRSLSVFVGDPERQEKWKGKGKRRGKKSLFNRSHPNHKKASLILQSVPSICVYMIVNQLHIDTERSGQGTI